MLKILKSCKKGFTLLELLVVVLIIGILASIALPQYDKAVTKARLAEVLLDIKAMEGSIDRYLLKNGFSDKNKSIFFQDFADIELSGGEWDDNYYYYNSANKGQYNVSCGKNYCSIFYSQDDMYSSAILEMWWTPGEKSKLCYTNNIDKGRFVCKYLEPLGWEYIDDEW